MKPLPCPAIQVEIGLCDYCANTHVLTRATPYLSDCLLRGRTYARMCEGCWADTREAAMRSEEVDIGKFF